MAESRHYRSVQDLHLLQEPACSGTGTGGTERSTQDRRCSHATGSCQVAREPLEQCSLHGFDQGKMALGLTGGHDMAGIFKLLSQRIPAMRRPECALPLGHLAAGIERHFRQFIERREP